MSITATRSIVMRDHRSGERSRRAARPTQPAAPLAWVCSRGEGRPKPALSFSGSVSCGSRLSLNRACAAVEHSAHQPRIEIEGLYGQQDTAFSFLLPLARGLS